MTSDPIPSKRLLSVVAPVHNEAQVVERFVQEVCAALEALSPPVAYELILVDDGSTDETPIVLDALAHRSEHLTVLHLARNFGQGAAISAGIDHAQGDALILMDADLQDDPAAFPAFLEKWLAGYAVVYAVRTSRMESLPIRCATAGFYRMLSWISDTPIPCNAGTFSLMDRRVVNVLRSMPERNRFLPGLRAWAGFRQTGVPAPRRPRYDRQSRVGLRGMWRLSMNAVFAFSYFPIFIFRALGVLSLAACVGVMGFVLYHKWITGKAVTAWASQMLSTLFFGGINLLGIGIIGEYVARIYDELKRRPAYLIDRITPARSAPRSFSLSPPEAAELASGVNRAPPPPTALAH